MSIIEVCEATTEDIQSLSALSIEVWLDSYAHDGVSSAFAAHVLNAYSPEAMAADLAGREKKLLVCRNSFGLLGYIKLDLAAKPVSRTSGTAEIETLYIRRHHQRSGLGKRLFDAALQLAGQAGHRKLFLTVYEGNASAIAFYRAQGMRQEGEWIFEFEGGSAPNLILTRDTEPGDRPPKS